MTLELFIMLVSMFAIISSFFTEAVKKWFLNANKTCSANLVALINAAIIGCGGTIVIYLIIGIPFTIVNIAYILIMILTIWMGSMIGYDKMKQLITQITKVK